MRLATWNVQHGAASAAARAGQRRRVDEVGADVWVLTQADRSLVPAGHAATASATVPGSDRVHAAVLTAEQLQPLAVPELPSGAAGVVTVGGRRWLVVAACLPAPQDRPAAGAPAAPVDPHGWSTVARCLDDALQRLTAERPGLPLLLAGDFGQTLTRHVVGSRAGRARLTELLHRHRLAAYTAGSRSSRAGCASVDHVCGPDRVVEVDTWSTIDAEAAVLLSDHLGYVVTLRTAAVTEAPSA